MAYARRRATARRAATGRRTTARSRGTTRTVRGAGGGYRSRSRSGTARRTVSRGRSSANPRTIRIVIEQPTVNAVARPGVAASESAKADAPKKAKF